MVIEVRVVRVFTDEHGRSGNPLGIVADAATSLADPDARQALAAALGYSETVFIDAPEKGEIVIYSPRRQVPFAAHAAVGAAWIIARLTGQELARQIVEAQQLRIATKAATT